MTNKVTLPEPFMYGIMEPDGTPYFGELCVSGNKGDLDGDIYDLNGGNEAGPYQEVALITTTQAEAYKDACVREALEEAAALCDRFAERDMHPEECAGAIRLLITKEKS